MSISKEKFKEMLREKGLKVTNQRILVLEVLADHRDKHLTAEDIYELVREDYPEIGLATIYRTVQLLLEMQLVDRINLDDGCARYEIGEFFDGEERHHHHHLICRTCGKIIPFKDDLLENLEDKIEETTIILSSYSKAVMFIPIFSRPPSGMIRIFPLFSLFKITPPRAYRTIFLPLFWHSLHCP